MNKAARSDDTALFDELYDGQRRAVYAYLLGQTSDRDAAADLLQETFVRVWTHLDEVRAVAPARRPYWILAVARNLVVDHRRRRAVRGPCEAALTFDVVDAGPNPAKVAAERTALDAVDAAIRALPEELRLVLTMSVVGEMKSEEIGRMLGAPAATIRYRLAEARRRIARQVEL